MEPTGAGGACCSQRVPSSWVRQVQANTVRPCSEAARLQSDLDNELQARPSSVPSEVAIAAWSRRAVLTLHSNELQQRMLHERMASGGIPLAHGVAEAVEAVRMQAQTAAAYRQATAPRHQAHLTLTELLEERRRQAAAAVPFGAQKAATQALLQSAKLRAVASFMLQHPASRRVCTQEGLQERRTFCGSGQQELPGWECEPPLHELLLQVEVPATLCALMRAGLPGHSHSCNNARGSSGDALQQSGGSNSAGAQPMVAALSRLKPSDAQVQGLLARSQQLRQQAGTCLGLD